MLLISSAAFGPKQSNLCYFTEYYAISILYNSCLDLKCNGCHSICFVYLHCTDNRENTGDESDDQAEGGKIFSTIRGPKKNEKIPECVQLLEKVEREHGFVGRWVGLLMVSCFKDIPMDTIYST